MRLECLGSRAKCNSELRIHGELSVGIAAQHTAPLVLGHFLLEEVRLALNVSLIKNFLFILIPTCIDIVSMKSNGLATL